MAYVVRLKKPSFKLPVSFYENIEEILVSIKVDFKTVLLGLQALKMSIHTRFDHGNNSSLPVSTNMGGFLAS